MNYDIYTEEMSKSIWDKAFFMDKIIGAKVVIDFGCADGAMIRYLAGLFPKMMFIGYDINAELLARARSTAPFNANIMYFTEINSLIEYIVMHNYKSNEICVNFSSVLHEVFSSTGGVEVIQFLINALEPRYITIRDMYCDEHIPFVSEKQFNEVWGPLPAGLTIDFENRYGKLTDWRDMTHFLMKLQWRDNGWEEELEEDYYSWTIDEFIDKIGSYMTIFDCRYQLPYLGEKWKEEYGWYLPDIHTHAQFILRRDD